MGPQSFVSAEFRPRRPALAPRAFRILVCAMAVWVMPTLVYGASDAIEQVPADTSLRFVVEVGSRIYPNWHETVRVRVLESFFLADTDLTARIERFVPDFRINDAGDIINNSDELANPAVHVVVLGDSATSDSTWAFLNFPPHYSPHSFFTFQLKEIEGYRSPAAAGNAVMKEEDNDG